jgi:hypothetical protein
MIFNDIAIMAVTIKMTVYVKKWWTPGLKPLQELNESADIE